MKQDRLKTVVFIDNKQLSPTKIEIEHYVLALPLCRLFFSGANRINSCRGAEVKVQLDGTTLFKGPIETVGVDRGSQKISCRPLLNSVSINFIDETVKNIFKEITLQAGVEECQEELPEETFRHYHSQGEGWAALQTFTQSISERVDSPLDLFFDREGVLHLAPEESPHANSSAHFKSGLNTLLIDFNRLESFPTPVGYGESIKVDEETKRVAGVHYTISPQNSIMEVWWC